MYICYTVCSLYIYAQSLFSGVTVQNALMDNSIEATEETLSQLKYDPKSVWGYVEVS